MSIVKAVVIVIVVFARGLDGQFDDPAFVHNECVKAQCRYPSLCYIPHPTNCFKFIMCKPLETGAILGQDMHCGFGTKWKSGTEPSCDRYDLVDCPYDVCKTANVTAHEHFDGNCRTYWTCNHNRSEPSCCERYHAFNPTTRRCEPDPTCDAVCPLINEASCRNQGLRYANFPDGNCRTHWDCDTGHPHPVCCPDGQGFDVLKSACVVDPTCTDICPKEYSESCSIPGTTSYDLVDANCRTYMKCNKNGQADPFCCLSGMMYNPTTRACVDAISEACVNANCPYGYLEECRLKEVPGRPDVYQNLDAFGGMIMPCPVGTLYNATGCQCSPAPIVLPPTTLECTIAINAQLPDLKNQGSAVAALLMIGKYGQGEKGVGNMTAFWDGGAGINIPYYGAQEPSNLYLEARVRPTAASPTRQVLISTCYYIEGIPTFEISLSQFTDKSGILQLVAVNWNHPQVLFTVPYNFNDELVVRALYDGKKMGFFLDNINNPTAARSEARLFSGVIPIDRGGLRFAHCRNENNVSSFIGYVQEIKFSKCLTPEMVSILNTAKTASQTAPAVP